MLHQKGARLDVLHMHAFWTESGEAIAPHFLHSHEPMNISGKEIFNPLRLIIENPR